AGEDGRLCLGSALCADRVDDLLQDVLSQSEGNEGLFERRCDMSEQKHGQDMTEDKMIESTEAGEWVSIGDNAERGRFWQQAARQVIDSKRKRISILIPERDLARLKARAVEEGMPYQTLINSILHKYVS